MNSDAPKSFEDNLKENISGVLKRAGIDLGDKQATFRKSMIEEEENHRLKSGQYDIVLHPCKVPTPK